MEEKGRSRKRQRQPEKWIANECKKKRNSGKGYVSRHTKKEVPARTVGDPCTCRLKCFEKLGMDVIEQKSPFRKYFSPGSSVNGAFHAYVEWLKEKNSNEVPVKEDYYRRVFANEYNIGIETPSVDDCNICGK